MVLGSSYKIIDYIEKNKVSSSQISDCLGKKGSIKNLFPINQQKFSVGLIFWVYAENGSNWQVHKMIQKVPKNSIVFISNINCEERSIIGDLVSKYLIIYKQCKGIVVLGNVRDVHKLKKENWPIWCQGYNPEGCFNHYPEENTLKENIEKHKMKYHHSIAVCDDTGVVIIPPKFHNDEFILKLEEIESKEDEWSYSLNALKKSTFEIICNKNLTES